MRSTAMAVASPPPMHSAATPRLRFSRFQRMQQRDDQPRAGGADRMAERAGAAIDVELVSGDAEVALRRHRDDRKRLVDLEQVDVADAPADLVEQFSDRRDRRGGEPLRLLAVGGVALDLGERLQAVAVGERAARQDQRRGAVGIGGGGCRRDGAVGAERRLQTGNFGGVDLERMLVIGDHARPCFLGHGDRRDLGLERAAFDRLAGARQRLHRIGVLIGAGELIGLRGGLAEIAHRAAGLVGVFEAIHHHVVDDPVMAGAVAAARLRQQIGRIAHALHAAGQHDLGRAGVDDVMGQHGGLHAGAADLVDGGGAGGVGQFGAARGLPRRRLALAGRQHVAHEHLVDPLRREFCPLQRRADHVGAELVGAEGGQFAHEPAKRGAGGGKDDDGVGNGGHGGTPGAVGIITL